MGRKRKTDKHLPPRVYFKHGAFYYIEPAGKDPLTGRPKKKITRLGKTEFEALGNYGKVTCASGVISTMSDAFDRYYLEISSQKAANTYRKDFHNFKNLRKVFGRVAPYNIKAIHIYRYMDERAKKSASSANNERSLLSSVFVAMIRWGVISENPCRDVKPLIEKKKEKRYVEWYEFKAVYKYANPVVRAAMRLAYTTGLRQADILKMKLQDLKVDGIEVEVQKTGSKIIIEWSGALRRAVEKAKQLERPVRGFYLLCNQKGQKYTRDGFSTMFKRAVQKTIENGKLSRSFCFYDIRRKAATDAERQKGREFARQLLDHTSQKTTGRYVVGIKKIKPLL